VRSGSSFWLALSIHAVDLKMTNEGDVAGLEVTTAGPHPSTVFYRWEGRRFVKCARRDWTLSESPALSLAAGAILLFGCLAALLASVARAARR
jgi:hypothetical protein